MHRFAAAVIMLAACASTGDPATPSMALSEPRVVDYYSHIGPILDGKCIGCHTDGGSAPFSLSTFRDAFLRRDLIKEVTSARRMPPGPHPLRDDCTDYAEARHLTTSEIADIARWADTGAAEGDAKKRREPRVAGALRVDTVVEVPNTYTPQFRHGENDDYRCFVLDWPGDRERFITGFRAKPGVPHEVHHAIAFLVEPEVSDAYVEADAADPAPGYPCFGAPGGGNFTSLGSWSPGADGEVIYPAGTGLRVTPGAKIIVQMHYNALGGPAEPDQTSFEFQLDDNVRPALFLLHTNPAWLLPANMTLLPGDSNAKLNYAVDLTNGEPFTIYSAGVHMHLLGKRGALGIDRSDGSKECLIDASHDFNHQGGFTFANPKRVAPGDKISLECDWDNSASNQPVIAGRRASPKPVHWGEGTEDEMCVMAMYIVRGDAE